MFYHFESSVLATLSMIQIDEERYMLPELSVFIAIVAADAMEDAAS